MNRVTFNISDKLSELEVKPNASRQIEKQLRALEGTKLISAGPSRLVMDIESDKIDAVKDIIAKIVLDLLGENDYGTYVEIVVGDEVITEKPAAKETTEAKADEGKDESAKAEDKEEKSGKAKEESAKKEESEEENTPPYDLEALLNEVPMKHSDELKTYLHETDMVIPVLKQMNNERCIWSQNLLVSIDTGFGLTTFLRTLVKIHINNELIEDSEKIDDYFREITLQRGGTDAADTKAWEDLITDASQAERAAKKKKCTVVCIDISEYINNLNSTMVGAYLKKLADVSKNYICVFRVPFMEKSVVSDISDSLADVMNIKTLCVPPIPMDDMVAYMKNRLNKMGIMADISCDEGLESRLLYEKKDDSFFGYKTLNKVIDKVVYDKALKNAQAGEISNELTGADIAPGDVIDINDFDPVERLRELIGMEAISVQINEIVAQMKVAKELAASGADVEKPTIHMMFTGNPGTGKTTVARIVAKIMKEQGILRKGHMHEYRGRDLCGRYIGETAPKTSAICRDAYGSVLFIDEAYSLYRGAGDTRDYGREALDTLVAEMENHRDDMCVIFAGYKDEMEVMLTGNAGLRSRIPYIIEFPNYTREELAQIFFKMAAGKFEYDEEFENAVKEFFNNLPDETFNSKEFSNARFVRNLYEKVWGKAAYRKTISGDKKMTLLKSDLENVSRGDEFKVLTDKKIKKIGFV